MSDKEIKDIPQDAELKDEQLDDVSGGLAKPTTLGTTSTSLGATAGRTKIEFTGEEVDSQ